MRKQRILVISNYYYPHIGGIEQVARDIANSLSEDDLVMVICFSEDNTDKNEVIDGVEVVKCGAQMKVSSQSLSVSFGRRLKEVFHSFQPDTVIFEYPNPFEAHYLLRYLPSETKLILHWQLDIVKQKFLKLFFEGQTDRLLKRADAVIATSPNYIEGSPYLQRYREKITVFPNCIREERVSCTPEIEARAKQIRQNYAGKHLCFAAGRHVPYKGMSYLVQAARYLNEDYAVVIAGSGPLSEQLKQEAEGIPIVQFVGRISDEELRAYYLACDVFCFPSVTKNEAFGLAMGEAMRFQKPCVTFHIPGSGVNYVSLNGVTGLEVENGRADRYAEAIKTICEDEELAHRYGLAAKERAKTLLSYDGFRQNMKNLVRSVNDGRE